MSVCRCGHSLLDHEPFGLCTAVIGIGDPSSPRFLCGCDDYRERGYQTAQDLLAQARRRPSLIERIRRFLRMA